MDKLQELKTKIMCRVMRATLLLLFGVIMISLFEGFWDALGVFFMIWSNNIEYRIEDDLK